MQGFYSLFLYTSRSGLHCQTLLNKLLRIFICDSSSRRAQGQQKQGQQQQGQQQQGQQQQGQQKQGQQQQG